MVRRYRVPPGRPTNNSNSSRARSRARSPLWSIVRFQPIRNHRRHRNRTTTRCGHPRFRYLRDQRFFGPDTSRCRRLFPVLNRACLSPPCRTPGTRLRFLRRRHRSRDPGRPSLRCCLQSVPRRRLPSACHRLEGHQERPKRRNQLRRAPAWRGEPCRQCRRRPERCRRASRPIRLPVGPSLSRPRRLLPVSSQKTKATSSLFLRALSKARPHCERRCSRLALAVSRRSEKLASPGSEP